MEADLPFRAEYAASNRASCRECKTKIDKDTLRLAKMVQSSQYDGKTPYWYHHKCFFKKQRPAGEGDIAGYENIRYDDQQKISKGIKECGASVILPGKGGKGGKGTKRSASESIDKAKAAGLKDFGVEVSATSRAGCRGCELKIIKGEVRIKKILYDTDIGSRFNGQATWYHVDCFGQLRSEVGYFETGELLPGYKSLNAEQKECVKKALPVVSEPDIPIKKIKNEIKDEVDSVIDKNLEKTIKTQNAAMLKMRDYLKSNVNKTELLEILRYNKQKVPEESSVNQILDQTCDIINFGALLPCPKCNGTYVFGKNGYRCMGDITEYTKCLDNVKAPPRIACKIPSALKKKHIELTSEPRTVQERAFIYFAPSVSTVMNSVKKEEPEATGPKIVREKPPLYLMKFAIVGTLSGPSKEKLKSNVERLGGKLQTKIEENLIAVISSAAEVTRMGQRMEDAKQFGLQVLTIDFIDKVKTLSSGKSSTTISNVVLDYIIKNSIVDWGTDPHKRLSVEETKSMKSRSGGVGGSMFTKSLPKSVTLKLKNGTAVDPDSGLDDIGHVYIVGKTKYYAILGKTDIQTDKNSYYKIQLIEHNNKKKYSIFRAWGRIGTSIGGTKVENFRSVDEAIEQFEVIFMERTGNMFGGEFHKEPGRYAPVEVDFGDENMDKKLMEQNNNNSLPSKLSVSVQNLIKLMFDIETMKRCLLEFDLDVEKMPLGKLSQKQLQKAMIVLNEINGYIESGGTASNTQFIDGSNRFYTLIPHDFGVRRPPILDTVEEIRQKIELIESLMEIEIAYSMLKSDAESSDEKHNPIDGHYDQLKTDITVLDRNADEFKTLEKYVQNTHAATHSNFTLIIEDIFKIGRKGEERRFKPFKKMHNRQLLWHGSRLTNYAGILSHGLKIAPPEAPATGYMFGKGIYFADMVSKSANYCCTSGQNNIGLMLLCEVALGDMYECKQAEYVTKLPSNKHSCKGLGKTYPDVKENIINADGVIIPAGKQITDNKIKSTLLYNEYIVYDVAQVNCKYLFRMKFDYNI